ncbi:hypothetical protein CI102_3037 [Trichoderma harzianum]|nr:hypothetical protein CI102_3037 [Trichoderma harzianum]
MWLRYRVFSNASPFFFGLENKPQSYLGWDLTLKGLLRRGLGTADLGKQSQSPGPVDRLSVLRIALQHGSLSFRAASMHCPSTPLSPCRLPSMSRYSFSLLHITEKSICDTSNGSTRTCGSWNQHPILASCKATSDLVWRRRVFQNSNRVVTENHLARAPTVARESKKIFVFFSIDSLPAIVDLLHVG